MAQTADKWRVTPLLGALLVALLPQVIRLPLPITAWCLVLWSYMYLTERLGWPRPNRVMRWVLIAAGTALVLFTYRFLTRDGFSIGMLVVMAGLKPIEVRSHRDRMVTVFLAYFLAITSLFDFENLLMTGFMFISVLVTTAVLIRQSHPGGHATAHLRTSAVIMAQAVPLMILLFAFFPRTYGSSWGLAAPGTGVTGFSDLLRLGDVSRLVRSDRVAFRAEFDDAIPPVDQLYWRGVVFESFDGTTWRPAKALNRLRKPLEGDQTVEYGVSVEAYNGRWLFALDLPVKSPPLVSLMDDYTLRSRGRLTAKTRYRMTSATRYVTEKNSARRRAALQLPEGGNPRARRLALEWKNEQKAPWDTVDMAMSYFSENGFAYTLSPPASGEDAIDDFLFEDRRGFCEHYASAFVFLMRAAGIPARLVGGFLGGERNPYGRYLVVRDAHAHSWAEVWIDGKGWIRVDPTLTVAPQRATLGFDGQGPTGQAAAFLEKLPGVFGRAWQAVRYAWDLINTEWDFEIMGYSADEQRDILTGLGIRVGIWTTPLIMLISTILSVALLYVGFVSWRTRRGIRRRDSVQDHYVRFCDNLAALNMPRRPSQGPVDYARMVGEKRQDLRHSVEEIIGLYVRLRYGDEKEAGTAQAFFCRVRKFKPPRRPRMNFQ